MFVFRLSVSACINKLQCNHIYGFDLANPAPNALDVEFYSENRRRLS